MASIRPRTRADGTTVYAVLFRVDGKQASETFVEAKAAADFARLVERLGGKAARDVRNAHDESGHQVPTLRAWFDDYLAHHTGVTEGTRVNYRRVAERTWMSDLGDYPVDTITTDAIRRWVGRQAKTMTRLGTPTSAKTIANAHGLLFHVMKRAVKAGLRPDNPCDDVDLPDGTRREGVFLSPPELGVLLEHLPDRWRPLVLTAAGTGMRWGEITALTWADVHLDAAVPVVVISKAWKANGGAAGELGAPKSKKSRRTISLPAEVVDVLRPLRGAPGDLVFTAPEGGRLYNATFHERVWRPAVDAAYPVLGKRPSFHDLRHTHASLLIAAGVPLPVLQERLGHESIQTTVNVYGHLAGDALTVAARAASAALAGISAPEELRAIGE